MKVEYIITYNPSLIEKTGELMAECDLGITGVEKLESYIVSWNTTDKTPKDYLRKIKKELIKKIEEDGSRFISMKKL